MNAKIVKALRKAVRRNAPAETPERQLVAKTSGLRMNPAINAPGTIRAAYRSLKAMPVDVLRAAVR